jgi:hypothetical protein
MESSKVANQQRQPLTEYHPEALTITIPSSIKAHGGSADRCAEKSQQQQYQPPPPQLQYLLQPSTYSPEPVNSANGEKMYFNQTFRVVKPWYNDI